MVLNDQGHILTCAHIIQLINTMESSLRSTRELQTQYENRGKLPKQERRAVEREWVQARERGVSDYSVWWAVDGATMDSFRLFVEGDMACARLTDFPVDSVAAFPRFMPPDQATRHATSLLRIGYPLHDISPEWDEAQRAFALPAGSVPPPLFPIEGILTRLFILAPSAGQTTPHVARVLETSSPGLRGQSGGPILDVTGAVWGMQSRTVHHELGFSPQVPGKAGQVEHQFLNAGWATHVSTITEVLSAWDVPFTMFSP